MDPLASPPRPASPGNRTPTAWVAPTARSVSACDARSAARSAFLRKKRTCGGAGTRARASGGAAATRGQLWLLACLPAVLLSCAFDAQLPGEAQFSCLDGSDCPDELACLVTTGRCVLVADPCVVIDPDTGLAVAAPDGNACIDGVCAGGQCQEARCGDGWITPPESCDDGNDVPYDTCKNDCSPNVCGDGVLHWGIEKCDDGNEINGDGCDEGCIASACGNGILAPQEQCDDGNLEDGDNCDSNCTFSRCGNGIRVAPEGCDDGNEVDGDGCDRDCRPTGCGNGIVAGAEECDDGNTVPDDACTNACQRPRCGDGILQAGEWCDDGNENDLDACLSDCTPNVCGDGYLNPFVERCDDGNLDDADGCLSDCTPNICGDGIVNPALEACDDGNDENRDACLVICVANRCGDGFQHLGVEDCDDGDTDDGNACTNTCMRNVCGDGILYLGVEACDDGNRQDGDGCRGDCGKQEACGDSVTDANEDCDDGNENPLDGCDQCRAQQWRAEWVVGGRLAPTPGRETGLSSPHGVIVDEEGRIYFSEPDAHRVRRIELSGEVVTVAGTGMRGNSDDTPRPATAAFLDNPRGLALDRFGQLYIADTDNGRVRRVRTDGFIETFAGQAFEGDEPPTEHAGDHGPAREAILVAPYALAFDRAGRLYIGDYGRGPAPVVGRVRRVNRAGVITTIAGGGTTPLQEDTPAAIDALSAQLYRVTALAIDPEGRVFIGEAHKQRISMLDSEGRLQRWVGAWMSEPSPNQDQLGDGGDPLAAGLAYPFGLTIDPEGNLCIADSFNSVVRRIRETSPGVRVIENLAGVGTGSRADGTLVGFTQFHEPYGIDFDPQGRLVVVEYGGHRVRRVASDQRVYTVAGTGTWALSGDGLDATAAWLERPQGVGVGADGTIYIAETFGQRIRAVAPDGTLRTVAGLNYPGNNGSSGVALEMALSDPRDVEVGDDGVLFVADYGNHRIVRIEFDAAGVGSFRSVAGDGRPGHSGDGGSSLTGRLDSPLGVFSYRNASGARVLLVAQGGLQTGVGAIRRVILNEDERDGVIDTVVGGPGASDLQDGALATNTRILVPIDVVRLPNDAVVYTEYSGHRVRALLPDQRVYTVAGTGTPGGEGEGGPARTAQLQSPWGLAVDTTGSLYIGESGGLRVSRVFDQNGVATLERVGGAGEGVLSGMGGDARDAVFLPMGIAIGPAGHVFVAGGVSGAVYRIDPPASPTRRIQMVAGPLRPEGSLGPALQAQLLDVRALHLWGRQLLVATGSQGFVFGVDLDARHTTAALGKRHGSADLFSLARHAPPLAYAHSMTLAGDTGLLYVSEKNAGRLRVVQVGTEAAPIAMAEWGHAFLEPTQSVTYEDIEVGLQVPATTWRFLDPVPVAGDGFLEVVVQGELPNPGDVDLYVQFDDQPLSSSFDCRSAAGYPERCVLVVPAGASTAEVALYARAESTVEVSVRVDSGRPWQSLSGISLAADGASLLGADPLLHCVRRLGLDGRALEVVHGTCGSPGSTLETLRDPSGLLTSPHTGALYIADAGNRRVLRRGPDGRVEVVVGDGTRSSAGEGAPARDFPLYEANQLAMDGVGNLYIAAGDSVRMVANIDGDGDADGDDRVVTLLGGASLDFLRDRPMVCISAVAWEAPDTLYFADACEGVVVKLSAEALTGVTSP